MLHINQLSNKATQYAIPNEVDVILDKMGGKEVNAFTSNDVTVYYNQFPSNQLEKWLTVYAERFRNPVFRLFQSELETVYEEKNMYDDSPVSKYKEYVFKEAFGDHPYGRPIVGLTEHLKNPQTSRMREFYNTYYVANNMTLILVGDFNTEEVIPMVKEKFGIWKSGKLPEIKEGMEASEEEINAFCKGMPRYKRPKKLIFAKVPRNPTGKIEKPVLRKMYGKGRLVEAQTEG